MSEHQLPLFADIIGPWTSTEAPEPTTADPPAEAPASALGDRQLGLFADRAVLSRELEAAIASGRFEDVTRIRGRIEADFGPDSVRRLHSLARFDGVSWDPPQEPLSAWAAVDPLLAAQPSLQAQVRAGVFGRLLRPAPPLGVGKPRPGRAR